ncbi:uncharacterized protein FPRO_16042 [Fusarium proliferatum ET1]|uniref:Related to ketoreductase n=1 Tax=Fusarium proliferatum (strain ET1) TaxID=1227346 RepID=A0A1L7WB44_FUSPR|nr:uncharacterized protein FPRO_16042 [Fusarium proliferatum ET1]CZR49834.1 related to ketoreductase [Fusarium proliferatum ET1]
MSFNLTYLITGANRGIGLGFVAFLLQRPQTTVIAAVRNPSHPSSRDLLSLAKASGSKLILIKIDAAIVSDATDAVAILQKDHGITVLDIVIANAGISCSSTRTSEITFSSAMDHFAVNAVAPLLLFTAVAPLLKSSKNAPHGPVFLAISSSIASNGAADVLPVDVSPYGASKAALNWFVRRLHFEEQWLTSFVIHPGMVQTEMAASMVAKLNADPRALGAITVKESVDGVVAVIDAATRDKSGRFMSYDGTVLPW